MHSFIEKKETPALRFGSAFHDAILLPNLFADKYVVELPIGKKTKDDKLQHAQFAADNAGKTIMSQDDMDRISAMIKKIREVEVLQYILANGEPEVTFFWRDPFTDVLCKCRCDWLFENGDRTIIIDFKTTKDSSRKGFMRSIADYNYHRSGAFYLDGVSRCLHTHVSSFALIAIESEDPFELNMYCLGNNSISAGRALYSSILQKYKAYLDNKDKYHEIKRARGFEEIDAPNWALNIE